MEQEENLREEVGYHFRGDKMGQFTIGIPNGGSIWGPAQKKKKRQVSQSVKNWAWDHLPHKCNICGRRVSKISEAEFDHTRAHSKGGATNLSNVKIVHRSCNRIKGKKTLSDTKKLLGIISKKKAKKKRKSNRRGSDLFGFGSFKPPKFKLGF